MKKFNLIVVLALSIVIGGVFATWMYTQDDVTDVTSNSSIALTSAEYSGTYGEYTVDTSALKLTVDPKEGTTHDAALLAEGNVVIKFTPNEFAPKDVKDNAVASTFDLSLGTADWKYNNAAVLSVDTAKKSITWTAKTDGTFECVVPAATIKGMITLTDVTLDTKAKYDDYKTALAAGQIILNVSDGKTQASE